MNKRKNNKNNETTKKNNEQKHTGNDQNYYRNHELTNAEFARDFEDCCNVEFAENDEDFNLDERNLESEFELRRNNFRNINR